MPRATICSKSENALLQAAADELIAEEFHRYSRLAASCGAAKEQLKKIAIPSPQHNDSVPSAHNAVDSMSAAKRIRFCRPLLFFRASGRIFAGQKGS